MQSSGVDPLSSPSRLSQVECERVSAGLYSRISLSSDGSFDPTSFLATLKSRMSPRPLKRRYKQWPVNAANVVWSWAASLPDDITGSLSRSVRGSSCVLDDWRAFSLNQVIIKIIVQHCKQCRLFCSDLQVVARFKRS